MTLKNDVCTENIYNVLNICRKLRIFAPLPYVCKYMHYKIKQCDLPGLEMCNGTNMLPA